MATYLTRDQIIQNAGTLVGNTTLGATFCVDWLNNIQDTLAQNHKFPELEKVATGSIGAYTTGPAISVSLPADFGDMWDRDSLAVIDSNGSHTILNTQTWDWYDMIADPLTTGTPMHAAFNLNNQTWTPYPQPGQAYTWQFRYLLKPPRLLTNVTIPFGSDEIFIQALFVRLLQYEDDQRYPAEYAMLQQMLNKYFGALNMSPIKSPSVRFNAQRFKTPANFR